MKILHVAETIKGGIATYLNDLVPLQQADAAVRQVRLLVPHEQRQELWAVPPAAVSLFRRPNRARGLPALAAALRREIAREQPDIIHVHSTFAGAISRVMSLVVPTFPPIVYCPHGWAFDRWGSWISEYLIRAAEVALARRSAKIVAISGHEYEHAVRIGIPPQQVEIIASGLRDIEPRQGDTPLPSMGDERRRKVLFVGRLDRQKGSDILLEAVAGLQNEVVLYLVGAHVVGRGKPPEIASPHVQVLGWRSAEEINAYLADCDVLVIPSRWEGFGLVALEAMRLAKPIIASAVGGLKEIVVDGITGIHVPVADVDALRSAISRPTAQELVEMGLRGRERFERHYRIERVHGELRQLYAHVAGVKAAVSSSERSYTAIGAPVEDEK